MEEQNQNSGIQSQVTPQQAPVVAQENLAPQIKYAGFWVRWVAGVIDGLVLVIPNIIATIIIKMTMIGKSEAILLSISGYLVTWIYYVWMTNNYQATLGKKALGLIVISDKAEKLNLGQIIIRETIGKIISMVILFIGYIMAAFTKRKQALHDKIAGTLVIYKDPNKKATVWVIVVVVIVSIAVIIAIIGILASIVLVSLSSARGKAQDAGIKSIIASTNANALIYADEEGSFSGFVPTIDKDLNFMQCSGDPIVNISPDGSQMAMFIKSCNDETKYFCGNPLTLYVSDTAEVDESYVKSGATICNPADISDFLSDDKMIPDSNFKY